MPLSAAEAISPAMEHARKQLFQPFRLDQWARLAVVGFLTAEMSSGGGCNASSGFPNKKGGGSASSANVEAALHKLSAFWHAHAGVIAIVITCLIIFLFLLGIVLTYLNSRMRFVLFDTIIARECRIGEYWSRRGEAAWKFFIWQLIFGFCSLIAFLVLIIFPIAFAWSAGWMRKSSDHMLAVVFGGIFILCAFVVLVISTNVIRVFTKDFVVPYMAVEGLTVIDGWRRVWTGIKAEKGAYAGYIGMKFILSIAAGIIFTIVGGIAVLILAIPLIIIAVLIGVIAAGAGLAWNAFTITVVIVAATIGVFILIYLISLVSVPITVFFPAYSIHFLASRYPKLDALLHPVPPAPPAPEVPPQAQPPFFPSAENALGS